MHHRKAFSLPELLVVIGIIALLLSILIPVVNRARQSAAQVACSSNLRQIGIGLQRYVNDYRALPVRWNGLDWANPHVFHFRTDPEDMSDLMERYAGSRKVYYCPASSQDRTAEEWWPYKTGTIAASYQFPFWMNPLSWLIEYPDYHKLTSDRLLAADCLATEDGAATILMFSHGLDRSGQPRGMNLLFGDGHVTWQGNSNGFVVYSLSAGSIFWHYASY